MGQELASLKLKSSFFIFQNLHLNEHIHYSFNGQYNWYLSIQIVIGIHLWKCTKSTNSPGQEFQGKLGLLHDIKLSFQDCDKFLLDLLPSLI